MPSLDVESLASLVPDFQKWPVFIESGTFYGDTVLALEPYFDRLDTVELSDRLHRQAKSRYLGDKIRFHLGSSTAVMRGLLPLIEQRAIFFLDGHWSCGTTARGAKDVPLLEELEVIAARFRPEAVLIIDDVRLFGLGPANGEPVDWTKINQISIASILDPRIRSIEERKNMDKLVIHIEKIAED